MHPRLKLLLSKAIDSLDITLATLGCILAVPLTIYLYMVMRDPVYAPVGLIVFLTLLAYLLIRRRRAASVRAQSEATPRLYLLLNILFFALLTYSIAAFHLRPEPYTRPLGYFVATAAMAAVLAVQILFLPQRKSAAYFTLVKIIIIGLSLGWSQLLMYPGLISHDPWYHQTFTARILDAGHIPAGCLYSGLPGMHLVTGSTALITGLDYKMATMLSVSLLQVVCNTLFIFLLGKFIHSTKAGLLAALVLSVGNWYIMYVYSTIPMAMAVIFIPIVIYLFFKLRQESPGASICLAALFMVSLIVTHGIAALMLAMLLFFVWLGAAIHNRLRYQAAAGLRIFLIAAILFSGATLIYSGFVSGQTTRLNRLMELFRGEYTTGLLPPGVVEPPPSEPSPLSMAVAQYRNQTVPAGEHLFNNLGFYLFCTLAFVGAFTMVAGATRNRYGFAFVAAALLILAVNFIVLLPFQPWLSGRFNHFLQILLAVPLGIALIWLVGLPRKRIAGALLIGTSVFILSFLMMMSPQLNLDNQTFSPNTIVRSAFTRAELQAIDTAANFYDGRLGIDFFSVRSLQVALAPDNEISPIDEALYGQDYADLRDMLVVIREEIVTNPFRQARGPFRLDHDPRQALGRQGFSRVYDCGSVSGFIKEDLSTES